MCRNGYLRTIISGFVLEALIAAMFLCRCSGVITSDNQDVNKKMSLNAACQKQTSFLMVATYQAQHQENFELIHVSAKDKALL